MSRSVHTADDIRYIEVVPARSSSNFTYLLVHGLGGSLEQWSDVANRLGADVRTIAIDVPSFGQSRDIRGQFDLDTSVSRILRFCHDLDIQNCVLVSHSVGCVIAARMAAREPTLFSRLVLVSGSLVRAAELAQHPRLALSHPSLGFFVATQFLTGIFPIPHFFLRALAASRIMRQLILWPFVARPFRLPPEHLVETLSGSGSFAVIRILVTAKNIDFIGILSAVPQPVELIAGADDHIIDREDIARMHQLVHVSREHMIPGCGHWPWLENPTELVDFIGARRADGTPTDHHV
jgi:pimeloyl-ACP methyl ester carboxylesterase